MFAMMHKQLSSGPREFPIDAWLDSAMPAAFPDGGETDAHLPALGGCVIDGDAVHLFDVDVNPIAALPALELTRGRA
jgi:hypothetical protein